MKYNIGLYASMIDPQLFGRVFAAPSMWTWRVPAKLIDGVPLTEPREIALYRECTGRTKLPTGPVRRLFIYAGRRAGKDRFESAVAIWRAALCADWRKHISPGEGAVVLLLGADNRQGGILSKYCRGLLELPMLRAEVVRDVKDVVEFKNGASLEIATNDARLVRGRSAIAVLGTEVAFWKTNEFAASSDEEVVSSAEPSMSMTPDGGIMIMGSSVYRKRGLLYRKYKELFGNDDADELFWFATSQTMNPKLPNHIIEAALASNPARARAEYHNIFRDDISECFPPDAVDNCTDTGVYERAPMPNTQYFAHADAAGGTGKDSFAFSISHRGSSYTIDVVREFKPRFIPASVIGELATLCKAYGITVVRGDKYAIGFHLNEWKTHGIAFEPCENTTSENYLTVLPLMLAGRVRLVDNKTLRAQLGALERKPGDAAREQVSHPQHDAAHDDVSCAVAGAIVAALPPADGSYSAEIWERVTGIGDQSGRELALMRLGNEASRVDLGSGGYRVENHWNQGPQAAADALAWERHRAFMMQEKT
jgi:hypothetical protein